MSINWRPISEFVNDGEEYMFCGRYGGVYAGKLHSNGIDIYVGFDCYVDFADMRHFAEINLPAEYAE